MSIITLVIILAVINIKLENVLFLAPVSIIYMRAVTWQLDAVTTSNVLPLGYRYTTHSLPEIQDYHSYFPTTGLCQAHLCVFCGLVNR